MTGCRPEVQITDVVGSMACIGAGGVVLAAAGVGTAGAVAGGIGPTAVADRGAVGTTVALVDLGLAAVAALGALAAGRVRGRPRRVRG